MKTKSCPRLCKHHSLRYIVDWHISVILQNKCQNIATTKCQIYLPEPKKGCVPLLVFLSMAVARVGTCEECDEVSSCYDLGFLGFFCNCGYGFQGNGTNCEGKIKTILSAIQTSLSHLSPNTREQINQYLIVLCLCISDDDECSLGTHTCPAEHSVCVNMPGTFTCLSCPFGVANNSASCLSMNKSCKTSN